MEFLLGTGGVIADFKRDGNADLAACGFGQLCKLFFGDGAGNVSKGTDLDLNVAYGPGSLATADLNGHDNLDIVSSNFDLVFGQVTVPLVLLLITAAAFKIVGPITSGTRSPGIRIVDINGDGKLDLVSALSIRLGDGNGNFLTLVNLPFENLWDGNGPSDVTVGDFNDDGKPDTLRLQAWHLSLFIN